MFDIERVLHEATEALKSGKRVKSAWPARGGVDGKVWNAATFDVDGLPWGVISGAQRPPSAELLDAAAAYSHHHGGRNVVALIGPDKDGHEQAPGDFRRRFQAAAWHGLGVVWVESEGSAKGIWAPGDAPAKGDFEQLAAACHRALDEVAARDRAMWLALLEKKASREAEGHVSESVNAALNPFGFKERPVTDRKFRASWRGAAADGVWGREGGLPASLALEVKVSEDWNAPFCQVFDDLGAFDAAIHVRLVSGAENRAPNGMREAMAKAEEALPLRYLSVRVAG
jgi:hypothetical protein